MTEDLLYPERTLPDTFDIQGVLIAYEKMRGGALNEISMAHMCKALQQWHDRGAPTVSLAVCSVIADTHGIFMEKRRAVIVSSGQMIDAFGNQDRKGIIQATVMELPPGVRNDPVAKPSLAWFEGDAAFERLGASQSRETDTQMEACIQAELSRVQALAIDKDTAPSGPGKSRRL